MDVHDSMYVPVYDRSPALRAAVTVTGPTMARFLQRSVHLRLCVPPPVVTPVARYVCSMQCRAVAIARVSRYMAGIR